MRQIIIWWAAMLFLGFANLPLANLIFQNFADRGWLFSKTIGLFLASWVLWVLNCCGILTFTQGHALLVIAVLCIANYVLYAFISKKMSTKAASVPKPGELQTAGGAQTRGFRPIFVSANLRLIILEEALLFFWLSAAVYIIGFRPEAYGTEKFMDYAFMTSMMRSLWMPFKDPWYAGEAINYYYGGQYIAAFLTKLAGSTAGEGYNLMRALVTAFSFMLPFSLVYQLLEDRLCFHPCKFSVVYAKRNDPAPSDLNEECDCDKKHPAAPVLGGLLGGTAVAFCGNFHYVIYGIIFPIINKIKGEYYSYWFPDSTRFIGFNPDLPDKTIHEFPAYSSVLGDLHAHYINILFVVTVTAVVYGWAQKQVQKKEPRLPFLHIEVLLIGLMTGVFRWTNYWDFPIYYVVCGSIFFFVLLGAYWKNLGKFVLNMLAIAAVLFVSGYLASLPFTMSFMKISSEIGLTHSHTRFNQLLILWGLPAACLIGYVISLLFERDKTSKNRICLPDLAALMYGLCAAGLVFLPEVIYVKDIYSGDHYRANTMFKLTYQAFILFGIFMAYVLIREIVLALEKKKSIKEAVSQEQSPESVIEENAPQEQNVIPQAQNASSAMMATTPQEQNMTPQTQNTSSAMQETTSQEQNIIPQAQNISSAMQETTSQEQENTHHAQNGAADRPSGRLSANIQLTFAITGLVLLLLTSGYIAKSCSSWFGNIFVPSKRIHTDASVFVSEYFASDFAAINYLNAYISGQPTILEAQGDSYSDYERVSVATGLPTVAGWRVHEWLWRENLDELDDRIADVRTIYTSYDSEYVKRLIEKYDITYIYVGDLEREKYPELDESFLQSLGEIVFEDEDYDTFIVKVGA